MFFERKVLAFFLICIVSAECDDRVFVGELSGCDDGVREDHAIRAVRVFLKFRIRVGDIVVVHSERAAKMAAGGKSADDEFIGIRAEAGGVFPDIADSARDVVERLFVKRDRECDVGRVRQHGAVHPARIKLLRHDFCFRRDDHAVSAARND